MSMVRRIAGLAGIPQRWALRWAAALGRLWQSLLVLGLGKPGTAPKLWTGFGMLVLLLLVLGTAFTVRLGSISEHFRVQTEIARPRFEAARELEILLLSYTSHVRAFFGGNREGRQQANSDADEVAARLVDYERLVETPEQRQLVADFSAQWFELRVLSKTMLSTGRATPEDLKRMTTLRAGLRKLLDRRMQPDALASLDSRTSATLSSLVWSLKFNLVLLSCAVFIALVTGARVARSVLNAQEALQGVNERYQMVLNASGAGIWDADIPGRKAVYSLQWKAMRGFDESEIGDSEEEWSQRIHPEDAPRVMAALKEHCEGKTEFLAEEYRTRRKDGSWMWIADRGIATRDAEGRVLRLAGAGVDVTARKEAECKLAEREKELRRVLDTAATGLVRITHDLRYVFANPPFAQLVGLPLEDIIGRPVVEVIGQAAMKVIRPCIDQVLRGERKECEIEVPFAHGRRFLQVIATPDEESDGRISGGFISLTDITERKQLESELLRISETEREHLATDLHDGICQDLIAVGATTKGLQRQLEKQGHPLAANLGIIVSSISQAAAKARQIAQGINPVVVGGDGLMGALRELVSRTAENHAVRCSFKCGSPVLALDPVVSTQLFLIAQEAIRNSVQHSGATQINVELSEPDSELCLSIQDNGRGLPSDAEKGRGLGLRGMRHQAGLIQGHLTIQNREGGGAALICCVPKWQEAGETKAEPPRFAASP